MENAPEVSMGGLPGIMILFYILIGVWIKRCLLLGRKVMANLNSILKTETFIILPIKVCLVKAMEKAMATHSSTLVWRIPWTEEADRLQFMGS